MCPIFVWHQAKVWTGTRGRTQDFLVDLNACDLR